MAKVKDCCSDEATFCLQTFVVHLHAVWLEDAVTKEHSISQTNTLDKTSTGVNLYLALHKKKKILRYILKYKGMENCYVSTGNVGENSQRF